MDHLNIFFKIFDTLIISPNSLKNKHKFMVYEKEKSFLLESKDLFDIDKVESKNILIIFRIGQHLGIDFKN